MVYIHGGAFNHGAGSLYGPEFIGDRDVLLVTFNYRLGALGRWTLPTKAKFFTSESAFILQL